MTAPIAVPGWASRCLEVWGQLPTTQARISVTLWAVIVTTLKYALSQDAIVSGVLVPHWVPDIQWLGFLIVMSGLDAAHFLSKRMTDTTYAATRRGTAPPAPPSA